MKLHIVKKGTVKTKKQNMTCDFLVDEPPLEKK